MLPGMAWPGYTIQKIKLTLHQLADAETLAKSELSGFPAPGKATALYAEGRSLSFDKTCGRRRVSHYCSVGKGAAVPATLDKINTDAGDVFAANHPYDFNYDPYPDAFLRCPADLTSREAKRPNRAFRP